jgi:hypothetical protein
VIKRVFTYSERSVVFLSVYLDLDREFNNSELFRYINSLFGTFKHDKVMENRIFNQRERIIGCLINGGKRKSHFFKCLI